MSWAEREAKRVGLENALDTAEDAAILERAREVRRENIRRVALASRSRRQPSWPLFPRMMHTGAGE